MEAVAGIAEVIAWVAFATAAVFGFMTLMLKLVRGSWETAPAEVADGEIRWMAADGSFHSSPDEHARVASDDDLIVHYRSRRPEVCYLDGIAHDERTFSVVAITLAGVGVVAVVLNLVASLVA